MKLGVNIDHVATLREVRKARYPDIVEAAHLCERGGADQITVHLREDRRHIQDNDVSLLLERIHLPLNLEMAFVPEMIAKAGRWRPYSVTLVPERRAEMTTESGLNLDVIRKKMKPLQALRKATRVYGFIDPEIRQVDLARSLGLEGVEFHTGPFAAAFEKALRGKSDAALRAEIQKLKKAANHALQGGLEVKAGHGLTIQNVKALKEIPGLSELNIGHSIVTRALILGLENAVSEMKEILDQLF